MSDSVTRSAETLRLMPDCPRSSTQPGIVLVRRLPGQARPRPAAGPAAAGLGSGADRSRRTAPRSSRSTFAGGVVMAGDRRATMGNVIAQRDIEKVFQADEYSCVGIAGTAGLAIEMVRLFQVELEHYEKLEGATLSLDGKANRLSTMIRGNLADGDAGPGRRAAVRRLRPADDRRGPASSPTTSPAAATRSTLPLRRLGLDVRPRRAEEALPRGLQPARTPSARASRRSTTRPTTTRPPAAPT